jgi:hypothetical protein
MLRLLTQAFSLTAIFAAFAFLPLPPTTEEHAAASEPALVWGNWTCAAESDSRDNLLAVLEHAAAFTAPDSDCPPLGEHINIDVYGDVVWGSADCDFDVDAIDGLLLLLWYEALNDDIEECPVLGEEVVFDQLQADWQADSSAFEVIGPYDATPSGSAVPQGQVVPLSNHPTLIRQDFFAHNNGPDAASATAWFDADVLTGDVFVRWISQTTCFDANVVFIPCGEAPNGQTVDSCQDGLDNDNDQAFDLDDSQCPEVRTMTQGVFQQASAGGAVYDRYLTVRCLDPGPVEIEFHNRAEVAPAFQDTQNNDESSVTLTGECFLTKGGSVGFTHEAPRAYSGDGPYLPLSFPQGGGPPSPQ